MAITKQQKQQLIDTYIQDLKDAKTTVIVKQSGIAVSTATRVRKEVSTKAGKLNVVRKRLFLRALKEAGLEEVGLEKLDGSIFALHSQEDEFGPLKVVNKFLKEFAQDSKKTAEFTFLGGWFEKKWQSGEYVNELANVPSKEELYSKLCYLFNYPLQSFACVLSEIAKKNGVVEEPKKEEKKVEAVAVEAVAVEGGDVKAEEQVEEAAPVVEATPVVEDAPVVEATEQSEGVPQGGEAPVEEPKSE